MPSKEACFALLQSCRTLEARKDMTHDILLNATYGILSAAALASLIGLEREVHGQPAGLRTHMILGVGAALAAIISISYTRYYANPGMPSDPGRIVAQVVSGVGFLGAGAILRYGVTIKGLTTASSLWTTAIIGIACGSQFYEVAAIVTVLVVTILAIIDKVEFLFLTQYRTRTFTVVLEDRPGIVSELRDLLKSKDVRVLSLNASMPDKTTLRLTLIIRIPTDLGMDSLIHLVNSLEATKSMELE